MRLESRVYRIYSWSGSIWFHFPNPYAFLFLNLHIESVHPSVKKLLGIDMKLSMARFFLSPTLSCFYWHWLLATLIILDWDRLWKLKHEWDKQTHLCTLWTHHHLVYKLISHVFISKGDNILRPSATPPPRKDEYEWWTLNTFQPRFSLKDQNAKQISGKRDVPTKMS